MEFNRTVLFSLFFFKLLFASSAFAYDEIYVGGSPLSVEVSSNGKYAVVPLHSPPTAESPNLLIIDLTTKQIVKEHKVRLRMIKAVFIENNESYTSNPGSEFDGMAIAAIFGDQSSLTIINPENGEIIKDIDTSPRPSNIKIVRNRLFITGSSTGDINVIDLIGLRHLYSSPRIGLDPRDFEIINHSSTIDYAYVSLGGEKSIAVIQVSYYSFRPPEWKVLKKIEVGYDPSSLAINADRTKLTVANLGGRSIHVFDINTKSNPKTILNHLQKNEWPVGLFPNKIIKTSDPNIMLVANSSSYWLTQVDLEQKNTFAAQIKNDTNLAYSGITSTEEALVSIEKGPNAKLIINQISDLTLTELPAFDLVGEPFIETSLAVDNNLSCPGFYFSEVTQQRFAKGGIWGKELKLKGTDKTFQGGMILKSNFKENGGSPGFGGFNITNKNREKQRIDILLTQINSYTSTPTSVVVTLKNISGENVFTPAIGTENIRLTGELDPGFYYFSVRSESNSPAGEFLADISTGFIDRPGGGFQGGLVVGGYFSTYSLKNNQKAFAGFCIKQEQDVNIRTFAGPTYGTNGADNLVLSLADRSRVVFNSASNTSEPIEPVENPIAPSYNSSEIGFSYPKFVYVDANHTSGTGLGTSTRPYRSISTAISKTNSSNVIYFVRPGVYSPSTTNEVLPIGSKNPNINPLRDNTWILGEDPATTIIDAEFSLRHDRTRVTTVQISSVKNVRFSGFTVKNSLSAGLFINNSSNVRVDHNLLTGNSRFGVGAQSVNRLAIDNNLVIANSESGIVASSSYIEANNGFINVPEQCPENFGVCIYKNTTNDQRADGILVSQGGHYYIANNKAHENGISGVEINNRFTSEGTRPALTGKIVNNTLSQNGGQQLSHVGTGILVTEFAHAETISGNLVNNNYPGGIAIFEDSGVDLIKSNEVINNSGNGLAIQKRSQVNTIQGNLVNNNGLSGIFLASDVEVNQIIFNEGNSNGTCIECLDAKNGLAVLTDVTVNEVSNNIFNTNSSGVQVANNSIVNIFDNNVINANKRIGLFIRENSSINRSSNLTMTNNTGIHAIFVSSANFSFDDAQLSHNFGEGLTISENGYVNANNLLIDSQEEAGIYLRSGGTLILDTSEISNGSSWGISSTGVSTNTLIKSSTIGNNSSGVLAQNGASIVCEGNTQISSNTNTQVSGNVSGCD